MSIPSVCVLISTYNGERFIREQLDSIIGQKGVEVQILIRDDGSSDDTVGICQEYANEYDFVNFYQGENIGVGRSFLDLLNRASSADYYAFADQDDVWKEDKLYRAVSMISAAECDEKLEDRIGRGTLLQINPNEKACGQEKSPMYVVLYASNQTLVDCNLNIIGERKIDICSCNLMSCISNNVLYGCTMVMNHLCRMKVIKSEVDYRVLQRKNHDGWSAYIAFVTGIVIYDDNSRILYRQHENNVVGGFDLNKKKTLIGRYNNIKSKKHYGIRSLIAHSLLKLFNDEMREDIREDLSLVEKANSLCGIRRIIKKEELRSTFEKGNLILYIKGLLHWI